MRRIAAVLICFCMVLQLTACGSSENTTDTEEVLDWPDTELAQYIKPSAKYKVTSVKNNGTFEAIIYFGSEQARTSYLETLQDKGFELENSITAKDVYYYALRDANDNFLEVQGDTADTYLSAVPGRRGVPAGS